MSCAWKRVKLLKYAKYDPTSNFITQTVLCKSRNVSFSTLQLNVILGKRRKNHLRGVKLTLVNQSCVGSGLKSFIGITKAIQISNSISSVSPLK